MVNFDISVNMYDKFLENDVLGTQDLLKLGLNKNDLTKLVSEGKLIRPKKGQYAIGDVKGLINYAKVQLGKKGLDVEKGKKALHKAVELDPDNGEANTRLFLSLIIDDEFEKAWDCFLVMDKTDNKFYKQDQNMWLYLLSFIIDLPEEYQKRVSEITYDDIKVLSDDKRFEDLDYHEKIRRCVMMHSFKSASGLSHCLPLTDRKLNTIITEYLLGAAIGCNRAKHNTLYKLIEEQNYEEAIELLEREKRLHSIGRADELFLSTLNDLVIMKEENKLPVVKAVSGDAFFHDVMEAKDYSKALKMNKESIKTGKTKSRSSGVLNKLLIEVNNEMVKLTDNLKTVAIPNTKKDLVGEKLFTDITSNLMQYNIDMATRLIGKYLKLIGKDVYTNYVNDLVELSVINSDNSFVEPMEALADIAKDDFEILPAIYIQDFYYNLARKNFEKAAIYLDILGMSEDLGGAYIGVSEMQSRLLEDAAEAGYTEADLGLDRNKKVNKEEKNVMLPDDKVLSVADVMATVGEGPTDINIEQTGKMVLKETEGETVVPQEDNSVIEEPSQVTYTVLDVVDKLMEDTNLVMLEPMSEEDIERVVETTASFQNIQTCVFEDETGEKRVVLRYFDKYGPYVDFAEQLRLANSNFFSERYAEAIENYQTMLPKLEEPKPFLYARLGMSYERLGDYNRAIDYYTMADVQSKNVQEDFNFSSKIDVLKEKCGYNGINVLGNDSKETPKQYRKENKNN